MLGGARVEWSLEQIPQIFSIVKLVRGIWFCSSDSTAGGFERLMVSIPIKSKFKVQYTLKEISSIQHRFASDITSYYLENIKGIYASKASGLWAVPIIIITRLADGGLYGER